MHKRKAEKIPELYKKRNKPSRDEKIILEIFRLKSGKKCVSEKLTRKFFYFPIAYFGKREYNALVS